MAWKAPTGDEIRGTVASTPGACFVNWHGEDAPVDGFDHNGTEHFYDDQDEMKIDGVPLFLDDSGHKWLQHHLIPANAGELSSSLLVLMSREVALGEALETCRALERSVRRANAAGGTVISADTTLSQLRTQYEAAKDEVISRRSAELAQMDLAEREDIEA